MSTNRGIFEGFSNQNHARADSPFAIVPEAGSPALGGHASSPFAPVARQESPFTVIDDANGNRQVEPGRPARVPERRKTDSPFQAPEAQDGFGFETPAKSAAPTTPFEPAPAPVAASPFSAVPQQPAGNAPSLSTQAALAAFQNWQESAAGGTPPPEIATAPEVTNAAPSAVAAPAPATTPVAAPAPVAPTDDSLSDSYSIRQLELRAVFGVDREMTIDEILQRTRALPGIRNIARVNPQDMSTVEGLKQLLPNLGFGSGALKLYSGSVPLEFIREGSVMLAVQTDGGFAPGVRETLMLVARELGRSQ